MPQMDLTFFPSQIFWLMLTFIILYIYIMRIVIPKMQAISSIRNSTMESYSQIIEDINSKIDELKEQCRQEQEETNYQIEQIYKALDDDFSAMKKQILKDIDIQLQDRQKKMQAKINSTKEHILTNIEPSVLDSSVFVINKISGQMILSADLAKYYKARSVL
jgi:F-type H+-transporting ATPase subunit b